MPGYIKNILKRLYLPAFKIYKKIQWLFYEFHYDEVKIIIGAGPTNYKGWYSTDINILDITNEKQFKKLFDKKKIDNILAEHVIEHLSKEQIDCMIENILKYSTDKLNIRIAVPDGLHRDKNYIDIVKPGGTGEGSDDHKHLFEYKSLISIFESHGLKHNLLEYWDENSNFFSRYSNDDKGFILRSSLNDRRNKDGKINYSSLIVDFTKL